MDISFLKKGKFLTIHRRIFKILPFFEELYAHSWGEEMQVGQMGNFKLVRIGNL